MISLPTAIWGFVTAHSRPRTAPVRTAHLMRVVPRSTARASPRSHSGNAGAAPGTSTRQFSVTACLQARRHPRANLSSPRRAMSSAQGAGGCVTKRTAHFPQSPLPAHNARPRPTPASKSACSRDRSLGTVTETVAPESWAISTFSTASAVCRLHGLVPRIRCAQPFRRAPQARREPPRPYSQARSGPVLPKSGRRT